MQSMLVPHMLVTRDDRIILLWLDDVRLPIAWRHFTAFQHMRKTGEQKCELWIADEHDVEKWHKEKLSL